MPSIVDGLPWPQVLILLTIQKLNPLILIFFLTKTRLAFLVVYFFALVSALVGSVGGLVQRSVRKILVFSSIAHLS